MSAPASTLLVPGSRYCSVMSWVRGRVVRQQLDHSIALTAWAPFKRRLHDHARAYIRAGHTRRHHRLSASSTSATPALLSSYESDAWLDVTSRRSTECKRMSTTLWKVATPLDRILLHGDFGPQNVMRYRSVLTPIDFQDLQFGFDVQDVGDHSLPICAACSTTSR